jgi:hypothetical protein
MPKPNSSAEKLAREAAARIDDARAAGQQLTFLPDEADPADSAKATRGKGKAASMLRDWLATRGMKLPEDQLAAMAGLAGSDDVFTHAMATAERVLIWAQEGATGYKAAPIAPSMAQRLETFKFVYTAALRASEALLPYGLAKVTPDAGPTQVVQVVVAGGSRPQASPETARDITPKARGVAPPPMPNEMQQKQQVSKSGSDGADSEARTE